MPSGVSVGSAVDGLKDWQTAPVFVAIQGSYGSVWLSIDMGRHAKVGSVHFHNYPYSKSDYRNIHSILAASPKEQFLCGNGTFGYQTYVVSLHCTNKNVLLTICD